MKTTGCEMDFKYKSKMEDFDDGLQIISVNFLLYFQQTELMLQSLDTEAIK